MSCRVVVLISGSGSNLQAMIDRCSAAVNLVAVISNRPQAYGLTRAANAGIPQQCIDHTHFSSREAFDQALQECIEQYQPDLVVLAGFMRILTPGFVTQYLGRMLNIHPSLLPLYPGLDTHARALAAGDAEHGCSIHFVTAALDGGPIVAQAKVEIAVNEDVSSLQAKVHRQEHNIYPMVITWFAEGRLRLEKEWVYLDDQRLPPRGYLINTLPTP